MTTPILAGLEADWHRMTERLHRHHQAVPAYDSTDTNMGVTVNLTEITNGAKDAIEQGVEWSQKFLTEHVPALLAAAQRYESSPIVQALESAVLPPAIEAEIAALITKLAAEFPAAPVPGVPVVPAGQMAEPQNVPA